MSNATAEKTLVELTADVVLDDLAIHEAEARHSYTELPADEFERMMLGQDIDPRAASRPLIEGGYVPHRLQKLVHDEVIHFRFIVLVCHRRWGKTVLAINALCDAAVRNDGYMGKPGRYAYVAPLLRQAKQVAWMYLKAFAARVDGAKKHEGELYVEFPNGSRITLYGAAKGQFEAMRGLYFDGVVFDEPAQMGEEVYSEVVRPALGDHEGFCIFIGTPKGINLFSERYDHAVSDDDWQAYMFRVDETLDDLFTPDGFPILTHEEVELIRKELTEDQFRQEMLCDFSASSDDVIISLDIVNAAMKRTTPSVGYLKGMEKVVGIDPAWMGSDSTAVAFRWGLEMYPIKLFPADKHDQIAGYLNQLRVEHEPDAWFMDQAYGEGIYARAQQYGIPITLVPFGGDAMDKTQFANRVTEMYFRHRDWLNAGGVLPDDYKLKAELTSVTYEFIKQGNFDVRRRHKKDEIKKKINRSPDSADACVLTTCEKVLPQASRIIEQGQVTVNDGGYHPHKRLKRQETTKTKRRR